MNNLKQYRTANRLTLSGLGELLGVGYRTVYSWENEESRPRRFYVMRMARLFECTPDDLGFDTSEQRISKRAAKRIPHPDAQALYDDFMRLPLDSQRYIAAYLSPDSYRTTVRKLREGLITDDGAALVRRMIGECDRR